MLLGGLLAVAAVGGASVAVAGPPAVWRQDNGVVGIDGEQLRAVYRGRTLTLTQVGDLNEQGKAGIGLNSIELACHGVSLYVDNETERDIYGEGYKERLQAVEALRRASQGTGVDPEATDPCAFWKGPVPQLQQLR